MVFQSISMSDSNIWKGCISLISFSLGDTEKPCVLTLVDDSLYEEEEEMRLVLGSATSDSLYGASIGTKNETLVKIKDRADSKRETTVLFLFLMWICKFFTWAGRNIISTFFSTFKALNQTGHYIFKCQVKWMSFVALFRYKERQTTIVEY